MAQLVKNLPAMQKMWVQYLGWKDPLEKEMATHSRILAWRIPRTEEPGVLSFRPAFSLSSFVFIKRLFSSSSLSAVRVVSSAYLRLLIFLSGNFDSSLWFFQPRVSHDVLCIEVK